MLSIHTKSEKFENGIITTVILDLCSEEDSNNAAFQIFLNFFGVV